MTSTEVPVSMWCWPGPAATAGVHVAPAGDPILSVFLDPVNVVLTPPPFPGGSAVMARFLRVLAREASRTATELESQVRAANAGGAHRAPDRASEPGSPPW